MELQNAQQTHRLEHLSNVHLQTALKLDEEPAYFWVDFAIFWPTRDKQTPHQRYPTDTCLKLHVYSNMNAYPEIAMRF